MNRILSALTLTFFSLCSPAHPAKNDLLKIIPTQTDELLDNPGIGWQTFHHTRTKDPNLPPWIPSTVHYARWSWAELEPTPGALNTEFLDNALRETRAAGQKLAFRIMCCSSRKDRPYHPAWLKAAGGRELTADLRSVSPLPIPDFDDPLTLDLHLQFIQRLGQRYDGHPDLDHVDLGSIGWWGEWHLSGSKTAKLPTVPNCMKVVDAYLAAFKKTPLLMLIGAPVPCLQHAIAHGAGWRADCLGDMGGFSKKWNHMRDYYPPRVKNPRIQQAWKTAPIAWESCWDIRKWTEERWPLRYIFNYALAFHASLFNNKSAPLPNADHLRPELERFLRKLGYRLLLLELAHPASAKPGTNLRLSMKWQNTGSAPCYKPYRLAYKLTDTNNFNRTFLSSITVNHWLPGSVELDTEEFLKDPKEPPPGPVYTVDDDLPLPANLPAGQYTLSVAVVAPETASPVVKLAIKGRDPDGWYPLSKIRILPPK
ncbi:MAG: DUF4832 domain-containing protein [Verrucomicrobiae bacterium]|nr:DUF4832 domain-containing protein [Verrucomicrobiae bacterium]